VSVEADSTRTEMKLATGLLAVPPKARTHASAASLFSSDRHALPTITGSRGGEGGPGFRQRSGMYRRPKKFLPSLFASSASPRSQSQGEAGEDQALGESES
jgi:hypothetical protein